MIVIRDRGGTRETAVLLPPVQIVQAVQPLRSVQKRLDAKDQTEGNFHVSGILEGQY